MAKTPNSPRANQGFSPYMREVEATIGARHILTPEQEAARARMLELMREGAPLNVERFSREEVYEERIVCLDRRRNR